MASVTPGVSMTCTTAVVELAPAGETNIVWAVLSITPSTMKPLAAPAEPLVSDHWPLLGIQVSPKAGVALES